MDIIVCVKETFDTQGRIFLDYDGNVDAYDAQKVLNPFDEYAIEEAVSLKEKFGGSVKVITTSAGDPKQTIFRCLAMGADNAIIISDPAMKQADAHLTALAISRLIKKMEFDLILLGREAVDDGASEIPSRIAELLGLPQVTIVSSLEVQDGRIKAMRDIDSGSELVSVTCPCILSTQKGLNIPRYPSMRGIMLAKKKPINYLRFSDLSISSEEAHPLVRTIAINLAPPRKTGVILSGSAKDSASKLAEIIRERTT